MGIVQEPKLLARAGVATTTYGVFLPKYVEIEVVLAALFF